MARLTTNEIKQQLPNIERALQDMVYGEVTIEVRGGRIVNITSAQSRYVVQNGRAVGTRPEENAG